MRLNSPPRRSTYKPKSYGIDDNREQRTLPLLPLPIRQHLPQQDIKNTMAIIADVLGRLGISNDSEIANINTNALKPFVVKMGNPTEVKTVEDQAILDSLRANILNSVVQVSSKISKRSFVVGGFRMDTKDQWQPIDDSVKIKDHTDGEPLQCPVCRRIYTNSSEILLAQTVAYHDVMFNGIVQSGKVVESNPVRMTFPHVVLAPICPQCYCSRLYIDYIGMMNMQPGIHDANVSPLFTIPDARRQIVPLLPKCLVDKIDNLEANSVAEHTNALYWPETPLDIICKMNVKVMFDSTQTAQTKRKEKK